MIKRYDWDDGLVADSDGDMCRWIDVEPIIADREIEEDKKAALRAEIVELRAERDALAKFAEDRRVQINELLDEVEKLKCLGTDLCTEATPWADVGARIDCATNRECLRHAITEFLSVGYDGRRPDENEYPLPIEVKP